MTLDTHLCYINSTQGQQHPQAAPVGKAEKTEEKFCMQNINVNELFTSWILLLNTKPSKEVFAKSLDTSFKLFQSLHKVTAGCLGKGLSKANISTCSG